MENKCNKTPNNNNNNKSNNCKYMDHVYCHNSESKKIFANNNASSPTSAGSDVLALLKENKQLKSMLILHLDLIQEQSDQLMAKEKQLGQQTDEMEAMQAVTAQQNIQIQELQKQLQRHLKRAAAAAGELSTLPPPLAKIQCKQAEPSSKKANIIGECNGQFISKIILQRVNLTGREASHSPNSTTISESASEADGSGPKEPHDEDDDEEDDDDDDDGDGDGDVDGDGDGDGDGDEDDDDDDEHDGFFDSEHYEIDDAEHIELDENDGMEEDEEEVEVELEVAIEDAETTEDSNDALLSTLSRGAKPPQTPPNLISLPNVPAVCATPPTPPSRGKQMPLMLWHAPDMHSDESASCDSQVDADMTEQRSTNTPAMDSKKTHSNLSLPSTPQHIHNIKSRRCAYISTPHLYSTREWVDDEFHYDYEFIKEEANALHADAPMLEIPKWTEHDELTPTHSPEGTEDLSDETFLKRHFKLELDEKRRKKWDVQQIREQRRIEKLKRRHCKNEIQTPTDQQALVSFYPLTDTLEEICFVNDLPVQAFGEMIPKLNNNAGDFALPWLTTSDTLGSSINPSNCAANNSKAVAVLSDGNASSITSAQAQQQLTNSSFVFLKKRRRMQSASNVATPQLGTTRQRSAIVTRAATQPVPPHHILTVATEATK